MDDIQTTEQKKDLYQQIHDWADTKGQSYRFEQAPGRQGVCTKYLYFDDDLVGIGSDISARQAKLKCAIDALSNLKQGKLAEKKYAKDGK